MKKASIKDIADFVGVSKALISIGLKGKGKEYRISYVTINKIIKVAKDLDYQPNKITHWFRTWKTQSIGLIIADISNPFIGKLGLKIKQEVSDLRYIVIFPNTDEKEEIFENQIDTLLNNRVNGLIISLPCGGNAQIKALSKLQKPYVLIDRYFAEIDSNYVMIDNYDASHKVTKHLVERGYDKIVFLSVNKELITLVEIANSDFISEIKNSFILELLTYIITFKLPCYWFPYCLIIGFSVVY